jgi:predicted permease
MSSLFRRLRSAFHHREVIEDVSNELDHHIDELTERYATTGMDPALARAAAKRRLGNVTRVREDVHDVTGFPWLTDLLADALHGVRNLRRSPGMAAAIIATLALGIGANGAIFSVINAVLLRPIPAPHPDAVVVLSTMFPEGASYMTSDQKFNLWRRETAILQDIAGQRSSAVNLTQIERAEQVQASWVTGNYFRLYGIPMAKGRPFTLEETLPRGPSVAILSDDLWKRAFGADPQIIGKRVSLSDQQYEVVGLTQPGVQALSGDPVDVWLPLVLDPASTSQVHYFVAQARLREGVTLAAANSRLAVVADRFRRDYPNAVAMGPTATFAAQPSRDALVANVRPSLLVLVGAVGLVLLIACANVANLQIAHVHGRQHEIAVRSALGASRSRVLRQLIAECLPLAMLGGMLGLWLGMAGMHALLSLSPGTMPRVGQVGAGVSVDTRVVMFTALLSVVTGLVVGLGPALASTRMNPNEHLKDGALRNAPRLTTARSVLIVCELAIAVALTIGAGVLMRSFVTLRSVDPGIETHKVLTVRMSLSGPRFATTAAIDRLLRVSLPQLESIPGVMSAAFASGVPLEAGSVFTYIIADRPLAGPFHGFGPWTSISPHYFDVFKVPVVRGRAFTDADGHNAPGVVIINDALAAQGWPHGDPLHARIFIGKGAGPEFDEPAREVVGIVANVHDGPLDRAPQPAMYVPAVQVTDGLNSRIVRTSIAWVVRTATNPQPLAARIQEQLKQATGDVPVARVRTMDEVLARTTTRAQFNTSLLLVFAIAAVLLASIGVYSLIAYTVVQSRPEIAIRMALGAEPRVVRNMFVRKGAVLIGIGITSGVFMAWAGARLLTAFLFGVSPRDPLTFIAVPVALALVALLATWRPASGASKVSPIELLRT